MLNDASDIHRTLIRAHVARLRDAPIEEDHRRHLIAEEECNEVESREDKGVTIAVVCGNAVVAKVSGHEQTNAVTRPLLDGPHDVSDDAFQHRATLL
jgi:hypothetical protein